jgi:hypothetical protein
MKEKTELLCKDCKHSFVPWTDWWTSPSYRYSCRKAYKPKHIEYNPVIGEIKHPEKYESCNSARMSKYTKDVDENHCGPEGKLWQPKHKRHLFLLIKKEAY